MLKDPVSPSSSSAVEAPKCSFFLSADQNKSRDPDASILQWAGRGGQSASSRGRKRVEVKASSDWGVDWRMAESEVPPNFQVVN